MIFRVTQEEYNHLKAATSAGGARSISDFARSQVLRASGEPSLAQVEEKLDELRAAVQKLAQSIVRS